MTQPGPKPRGHRAMKLYGTPADLAEISAYLQRIQAFHHRTDRSAAGILVLLSAAQSGFLLPPNTSAENTGA